MISTSQSRTDVAKAIDLLDTRRHEMASGEFTEGLSDPAVNAEVASIDAAIVYLRGLL